MGACFSCFRGSDEYDVNAGETSPLLGGSNSDENANHVPAFDVERIKRENELNAIVDFTGRNLIDLMSVQRSETTSIGRSAKEYRHLLAGEQTENPDTSMTSVHTLNTLKKWPQPILDSDKKEPPALFRELARKADQAVANEPKVECNMPLLEMFNPITAA